MRSPIRLRSRSVEDTRAIAAAVAEMLAPGDVLALSGDLGAGKTCFVQGAAEALGVTGPVTSPSFVLVREYQGKLPILHIDVYRMGNLQELVDLGYEEFLDPRWVVFIEWGDAVGPLLPKDFLQVDLMSSLDDDRLVFLIGHGAWASRISSLRDSLLQWIDKD
ncbi:MAG: tRNA (adenosine(37)-N6)-threonylcarbamoyltransferase complex ATPase subunit type 1 TsaE [Actinomycetota bacterium]